MLTQLAASLQSADVRDPPSQLEPVSENSSVSGSHAFYTDRHQHSQIFRLPTEILESVFFHCTDPARNHGHDIEPLIEKAALPTLAALTHVCRSWRMAALKYGALWCQISDDLRGRWSSVFIERSGPAPIDVHITLPRHPTRTRVAIQSQVHRVRELHVTGRPDDMAIFLLGIRNQPAPMLRSLAFHRPPENLRVTFTDPYYLTLPDELFNGIAPRLEELTLCSNIEVQFSSLIISNLRSLQVHGGLTLSRLHAVLRHTPNLQTLFVYCGFYDEEVFHSLPHGIIGIGTLADDTADVSPIELPHLDTLSLECDSSVDSARFIEALRFPKSTLLSLMVPLYMQGNTAELVVAILLESIADHVRGSDKHGISRIESVLYEHTTLKDDTSIISIIGWSADPDGGSSPILPGSPSSNRAPVFELRYTWEPYTRQSEVMWEPLFVTSNTLPLAGTRFLAIANKSFTQVETGRRDLSSFNDVEILLVKGEQWELSSLLRTISSPILSHPTSSHLGAATISPADGEVEDATTTMLLPRLKNLIITTRDIKALGGRLVIDLVKLVRSRKGVVDSVAFEGCDWVSPHISNMLRPYVRVTWDGKGPEHRAPVTSGEKRLGTLPEGGTI